MKPLLNAFLGLFVVSCVQGNTNTETRMSGLVGSTIQLPCEVNVGKCSMLHSIKWYRGSSRIFFFSDYKQKHSRSEGEYHNRASLQYTTNDTISYLTIQNLRDTDEAMYKCEITYLKVQEDCLPVQFIYLTTQIRPSEIIIRQKNDQIVKDQQLTEKLREGSQLQLTCEVDEGKPIPEIFWYKGNDKLIGSYTQKPKAENKKIGSASSMIDIRISRADQGVIIECQAKSEALNETLVSKARLEVEVKPLSMELKINENPIKQNNTTYITCIAHQARPAANIFWYEEDTWLDENNKTIMNNFDISTKHSAMADGTSNTESILSFKATRLQNGKTYRCIANNTVTSEDDLSLFTKEEKLNVYYAPIVTIDPNATITVKEMTDVLLKCNYDANPTQLKSIKWYHKNKALSQEFYQDDETLPSVFLPKANRTFLGTYFCLLENSVGSGKSLDVSLNISYPPTVQVLPLLPVNESSEKNVTLECSVLDGNPQTLLNVTWFKNNEIWPKVCSTNNDPNCRNKQQRVISNVDRKWHGNYSCSGITNAGQGPRSNNTELVVYYVPGVAELIYNVSPSSSYSDIIRKDSSVELQCIVRDLGRPEVLSYRWKLNGNVIESHNSSIYKIAKATLSNKANYTCQGVNEAGDGKEETVFLNVSAPPRFIKGVTFTATSILEKNSSMSCQIECDPPCDVFWKQNGIRIDKSDERFRVSNEPVEANYNLQDFFSINSTLFLNVEKFEGGALHPIRDDANYTCESTDNIVGPGVNSTEVFLVNYPPTNMSVEDEQFVNVNEGYQPPLVTCNAYGRPNPVFVWKDNNDKTIAETAQFKIQHKLYRGDPQINVTCTASNMYGNSSIAVYYNILYAPTCEIKFTKENERTVLICDANGNPSHISYMWSTVSGNSSDDEYFEKITNNGSAVILSNSIPTDLVIVCYVENGIGRSNCTQTVSASDSIWNMLFAYPAYVIYLAIALAVILVVIIICCFIIIVCRKRRSKEKNNNDVDPPSVPNLNVQPTPPIVLKWPLKPGVRVHVNSRHSLCKGVRGIQNGVTAVEVKEPDVEEKPTNGEVPKVTRNESQRSRAQRIKQMFTEPMFKSKAEPVPGVHYGNSGVVTFKNIEDNNTDVESPNPREQKQPATDAGAASGKDKNNFHNSPSDALLQPDDDKVFYENLPFHGMQNPPNKPTESNNNRSSSSLSQCDSSGYESTRSQYPYEFWDNSRFSSFKSSRMLRSEPQFRSLRTFNRMLPIVEMSPTKEPPHEYEVPIPRIPPRRPIPAPRKSIGVFNKGVNHIYQNVPVPIIPNNAFNNDLDPEALTTNSSQMEYLRLTPTNNSYRSYNGHLPSNGFNYRLPCPDSSPPPPPAPSSRPCIVPPIAPRHHLSNHPSSYQLDNDLYEGLPVSRHQMTHYRYPTIPLPPQLTTHHTYPYPTEYVVKFHDVGREIDV